MRINTNVSAFNAWRNNRSNTDAVAKSLERLSSGLRIDRAADDAAGLSISESMRAQVRGTAQAVKNSQDGISLTQVADGGLNEIASALQRVRELAVQAANSTYDLATRSSMQSEVTQLLSEIDNIAKNTTFNGLQLLSGASASLYQGVLDAMQKQQLKDAWSEVASAYNFNVPNGAFNLPIYFEDTGFAPGVVAYVAYAGGPGATESLHVVLPYFAANNNLGNPPQYNDRVLAHEMTHAAMAELFNMNNFSTWFIEGTAEFVQGADERIAGDLGTTTPTAAQYNTLVGLLGTGSSWATDSAHYSAATVATRYLDSKLRANGHATGVKYLMDTYLPGNPTATMDQIVAQAGYASEAAFFADLDANVGAWATAPNPLNGNLTTNIDLTDTDTGSIIGKDYFGAAASKDANTIVPNGPAVLPADWTPWNEQWMPYTGASPITLQVGANYGQVLTITPVDASSGGLGLGGVDLTASAATAIRTVDNAIAALSSMRANFGAVGNRLEHGIANLQNTQENLASAESRLRDADMADETMQLTRQQILAESSQSMLAQANLKPQLLLPLLTG